MDPTPSWTVKADDGCHCIHTITVHYWTPQPHLTHQIASKSQPLPVCLTLPCMERGAPAAFMSRSNELMPNYNRQCGPRQENQKWEVNGHCGYSPEQCLAFRGASSTIASEIRPRRRRWGG